MDGNNLFRARDTRNNTVVAVKLGHFIPEEDNEVQVQKYMSNLRARNPLHTDHINFFASPGYLTFGDYRVTVYDYVSGWTLSKHIYPMVREHARDVITQLLYAINWLHTNGITHNGLISKTVMLSTLQNGNLHATILDFKIAQFSQSTPGRKANITRCDMYDFCAIAYNILGGYDFTEEFELVSGYYYNGVLPYL